MGDTARTTLERQLARAIELRDHAAEVMLRARLAALRKPAPLSELELRWLHGDR